MPVYMSHKMALQKDQLQSNKVGNCVRLQSKQRILLYPSESTFVYSCALFLKDQSTAHKQRIISTIPCSSNVFILEIRPLSHGDDAVTGQVPNLIRVGGNPHDDTGLIKRIEKCLGKTKMHLTQNMKLLSDWGAGPAR